MAKDPQLVTPLEKLERLSPFEGRPVLAVGIEIPGAGGGLRDALTVDPQEFHYDDTVFAVIEGKVGKLRFDPINGADGVRRVHVLDVERATIVDADDVETMLEEHEKRVMEAKGIARLPYGDDLQDAHQRGEHSDGLVEGCPDCDAEVAAVEAERDAAGDEEPT
jgi:hypothetical protein